VGARWFVSRAKLDAGAVRPIRKDRFLHWNYNASYCYRPCAGAQLERIEGFPDR